MLILTRELIRPHLRTVTVAPITTTIRGLSSEVGVDAANGLAEPSVVSCDNITTIPRDAVGEQIGVLLDRLRAGSQQSDHGRIRPRLIAQPKLAVGRDRRVAAEALFEAMDSEQFDLDLEAVDRLNAPPTA